MALKNVPFEVKQTIKGFPMLEVIGTGCSYIFKKPDKIEKISANEVRAYYNDGDYVQIITADGEGDERHNFKSVIEVRKDVKI